MKLTLNNDDTICVREGRVGVVFQNKEYSFPKEEIEAVAIITTDKGPFYDDMCLVIRIDKETAVFIMSEHPRYETFLFDELKTLVQIDYNVVIKASVCTENNMFFLYKRDSGEHNK